MSSSAAMPEPLHRGQKLNWNFPINLIGEKVTDPVIHSCEICSLPILIYGRILPCKHVFCYDCSLKADKQCPRCKDPVNRIERCELGTIFLCTWGAPRHSHEGCRRTYLSQRDLQAHVNHRHSPQKPVTSVTPFASPPTTAVPPIVAQRRDGIPADQAPPPPIAVPSTQQTRQTMLQLRQGHRGNLITIQLQGDNSRGERRIPNQRSFR